MTRTTTLAVLTLAWIAVDCSAAPPEGMRGQRAREGGQGGGERVQQRGGDPAQMIARMMQEFDKDGDQKLDTRELTALMTSMRERRAGAAGAGGARAGGARPGRPAGNGAGKGAGNLRQRPGGDGKRKQGAGENNRPGGERPKRPVAE